MGLSAGSCCTPRWLKILFRVATGVANRSSYSTTRVSRAAAPVSNVQVCTHTHAHHQCLSQSTMRAREVHAPSRALFSIHSRAHLQPHGKEVVGRVHWHLAPVVLQDTVQNHLSRVCRAAGAPLEGLDLGSCKVVKVRGSVVLRPFSHHEHALEKHTHTTTSQRTWPQTCGAAALHFAH